MTEKAKLLQSFTSVCVQEEYSEMGTFMSKGQADGWLRPVIGQQYPLDQASDAHAEATGYESTRRGKIVLNVGIC